MPMYRIGETNKPVRPDFARLDAEGIMSKNKPTATEVNKWYDEAFRKFIDDPYVELEADNATHAANFRILTEDAKGNVKMSKIEDLQNMKIMDMATKTKLFEASRAGHLFYYDMTLGQNSGLRQVYTKTVENKGKTELELCTTDDVTEFPEAVEPKAPAPWKYIAAIFSKQYRQEIREYNIAMAHSAKVDSYVKAISTQANRERSEVGKGSSINREAVMENKRQRIKAYQEAKDHGMATGTYKSPADFLKELKDLDGKGQLDCMQEEYQIGSGATVAGFYRAAVKILLSRIATQILNGYRIEVNGKSVLKPDREILETIGNKQAAFRNMEKGLRGTVPTQLDRNKIEEITNNTKLSGPIKTMEAIKYLNEIQFAEKALGNFLKPAESEVKVPHVEKSAPQLQQNQPSVDSMVRK